MKKILAILLIAATLLCTMLVSCDKENGSDELFSTTAANKPQKTEATTKEPEVEEIPTNLVPQIIDTNKVIGRLTQGIEVSIDHTAITLNYQGWPTICKGEGDTLYAVSSARVAHIDPFGATCFYESHDGGETWSEPRIIADTPLDDRDGGIVYLGNGKILVSWFSTDASLYLENPEYMGWQDTVTADQKSALLKKWNALDATEKIGRSYVMLSNDGGKTWEKPVTVPVATPHGPVLCNDGRTLLLIGVPRAATMAGFNNMDMQHLYVVKSIDFGKTWRLEATLDKPTPEDKPFTAFCEPYILQLRDGSFIASARGQTGGDNDLLRTYLAYSDDGKNWSDFEEVEGLIGAPAHLFETKAGVLIMAYSYRLPPTGSRAMISYDGGKTWSDEITLCLADNSGIGDLGYPSTVELSDGTLITAYYQRVENDSFPSFLYTRWKLVERE